MCKHRLHLQLRFRHSCKPDLNDWRILPGWYADFGRLTFPLLRRPPPPPSTPRGKYCKYPNLLFLQMAGLASQDTFYFALSKNQLTSLSYLPIHQSPGVKLSLLVRGSLSQILAKPVSVGHYTGSHLLRHTKEHCGAGTSGEGQVLWGASDWRIFINGALCRQTFFS